MTQQNISICALLWCFHETLKEKKTWEAPFIYSYGSWLRAGGEGDDRGWDGWMASPTQWTWVWVDSRSWWWTGRPGVLWLMGSQRVGHDWLSNWTDGSWKIKMSMVRVLVICPGRAVLSLLCSKADSVWGRWKSHLLPFFLQTTHFSPP